MNENTRSDGAGQAYSRIYNRRLIFELLHQAGPLSRVDIADRIGLKPQTISGITRELLTQGLIHEVGKSVGQRGQPQTYLAPNPDAGYSLGMHVDQGRISIVLGDLLLNIRQRIEWVGETTDPAATTTVMAQLAESMILESGIEKQKIWGIGLVLPTLNADTYEAEMTMPGWDLWRGFDVAGKLGALLDLPVLMENDATAAAMAELFSHPGTPPRNAVLVY
ncbi:MAG: ROK family transcriptional regulator, partial [Gluconobacter oxydans]